MKVATHEQLVELTPLGRVQNLLEGDDIGVDSAQLTVDQSQTPRIALVVLDVKLLA